MMDHAFETRPHAFGVCTRCGQEKAAHKPEPKPSTPAALYEKAAFERGEALKTLLQQSRIALRKGSEEFCNEWGQCFEGCFWCAFRQTIKEVEPYAPKN